MRNERRAALKRIARAVPAATLAATLPLLCASCAVRAPGAPAAAPSPPGSSARSASAARLGAEGDVVVYLAGSREAGIEFEARWLSAAVSSASGEEVPLALDLPRIRASEIAGRQTPFASGPVPAGLYRSLEVVLVRADARAEGAEAPESVRARAAGDFRVWPGETVTLRLAWDLRRAVGEGGALSPNAFAIERPAEAVRRLTLYVTDERDNRVVAIARSTLEVFASIPVGRRPRGIDASKDGQRAYVANSGDDTITVIEPASHRLVDTLPLPAGSAPEDVAVTPDGRRIVVSCAGTQRLAVIDALTNALLAEVSLSRRPGRLAIGRDGEVAYVLLPEGNQVAAVDLRRLEVAGAPASVEAEPADLAIDPSSGRIYLSHGRAPIVSVLAPNLQRDRTLRVGVPSHGIALDVDGGRLFLTGGRAGGLSLVGPAVGNLIRRIASPGAYRVEPDPDGKKIYATGGDTGALLVFDKIAGRLAEQIRVGKSAVDIVVVP